MGLNRDSVLFIVYALVSAALTLCSVHGWISDSDQLVAEGVMTAFATAFHIPNAKAAAALKAQDDPTVTPQVTVVAEPASPSDNMVG
jgi:hypothetical protein